MCCDDIRDIELSDALKRLMAIFLNGLNEGSIQIEESIRLELIGWYISQPVFIQAICNNVLDESGLNGIGKGAVLSIVA